MLESWATSAAGFDLHLDVGRGAGGIRAALEDALRDGIRSGRLAPGTRLPSSRQLARDLRIARNTVADAYAQLVAEGWLTARQGSGTLVAEHGPDAPALDPRTAPPDRRPRYDLTPGYPDVGTFPATAWATALRRALTETPAAALGYGPVAGRPELRTALAGYLGRVRGVYTTPERIVVCSGFTQALALVGAVLRRRGGTRVAVEAYGHQAHRRVLEGQGLGLDTLPVDAEGAEIDVLDARDGDPAAVLLTSAHQFPLGPALSAARRARVIAWAGRTDALVVEDDYDGEFRYDRHPLGAVQGLAPDRVAYVGTASKSLAPGVRLGWAALPADLVDEVVAEKARTDGQTAVLDQLALARMIDDGGYDRHLRRMRLTYRRRRDTLVAALSRAVPAAEVSGISAGLHAVVRLPAGRTEAEVVERAARHDLTVAGLDEYRSPGVATQKAPPSLVVGYASPPAHAYTAALARLTAALAAAG